MRNLYDTQAEGEDRRIGIETAVGRIVGLDQGTHVVPVEERIDRLACLVAKLLEELSERNVLSDDQIYRILDHRFNIMDDQE